MVKQLEVKTTRQAIPMATRVEVMKRANWKCVMCGIPETQWLKLEIHHILPRCHGGTNDISNLIVLDPNCHSKLHSNQAKIS